MAVKIKFKQFFLCKT